MSTHWALLIGINSYKDAPLKGAVEDVSLVKHFLHSNSSANSVDITYLTATSPSKTSDGGPSEDPAFWPTYKNVTLALRRVVEKAKRGDCVYVHFSGHGTRTFGDAKSGNKHTGDLALVLYDAVYGTRYLRGIELSSLLRKMVAKGLLVTLVLDCCFSGSVLRHSDEDVLVRALEYDPIVDAAFPVEENDTDLAYSNELFRNAEINDWLVDPKGYAILSACGPDEKAFELKAGGVSHGALSYFLLSTLTSLRKRGATITQQSLHQHLSLKFHVDWPRQRPMRYGNQTFSFFDGLIPDPDLSFVPVVVRDGCFILGAGHAHGVHSGDEYSLFLLAVSETMTSMPKTVGKGKAVKVGGLTSVLAEVGCSSLVKQGTMQMKAKLLTRLSPWKASAGVQFQMDGLAKWMSIANQKPAIQLSSRKKGDPGDLFSLLRKEHNLEIRDGLLRKLPAVPTVSLKSEGPLNRVLHILEHLGTFKYFEGVQNRTPNAAFEKSFACNVSPTFERDGMVRVKDEGIVMLTVENLGDKPLYMTVFDMGPSWQIDNLLSQSGSGDYKVILPKSATCNGVETIQLHMCIPESFKSRGQRECEDIIKVFVTNMASSFSALELPDIATSLARLDQHHRDSYDYIAKFLDGLATRFRSSGDSAIDEKWAVWNIIVHTSATSKHGHIK